MSEIDTKNYATLQVSALENAKEKAEHVAQEQKTWDSAQKAREVVIRLTELESQIVKEEADRDKKLGEAAKDLKVVTDAADKAKATYEAASLKSKEAKRSLDEASAELAKGKAQYDFRQATAEYDLAHAVAEIRAKQAELAGTREVVPPRRP